MTLYRVSVGSPLIISLLRAAERNKQVTVLVEVTARFDEERNIHWARALEAAGAHVIYGVRGYKTHAKVCLIVRRTPDGLRRYVHLGTGNYNERTSRIYTDFGLMTSSRAICDDAAAVFNALTGYSDAPRLKKLTMAPTGLRQRFLKLIAREKRRAESGQDAEIVAKMNSLIDAEIIEALYAASRAGVKIRLNVRGICALRPGVHGHEHEHRGRLGRRSLPRALADLLLPQRRRRRTLPGERRLDDAQPRQARRADVPGRKPPSIAASSACAALDVPRQRQGALAWRRRRLPARTSVRRARRRAASSSHSRKKRARRRRWPATAPAWCSRRKSARADRSHEGMKPCGF